MFDLIVIGAGSGGLAAAKRAAGYGQSVLLCENDTIGGTCVSYGCVPKKLWHGIAHNGHVMDIGSEQGWSVTKSFDWSKSQQKISDYVAQLNKRHEQKCLDQGITIVRGSATFINNNSIMINNQTFSAKALLIAVGSSAAQLDIPGAEYLDTSYEFFNWQDQPKAVTIIGGGYIAIELASILNALGSQVSLVIRQELILRGFDQDLRTKLHKLVSDRGVTIHQSLTPTAVESNNGVFITHLSDGSSIESNKVLQAVGRVPNTDSLSCSVANVKCATNGAIIVNEQYQTSNPAIFALGDCIDQHQLTPVAIAQARQWVDQQFSETPFPVSYYWIPTAIFALPEAATVGLTEEQANSEYDTVETKLLSFTPMSLALCDNHKEQLLMKLILANATQDVVGIHMIGDGAAEIIQSLAVAVQKGITKADLDLTMALHPSVTEELVTIY